MHIICIEIICVHIYSLSMINFWMHILHIYRDCRRMQPHAAWWSFIELAHLKNR